MTSLLVVSGAEIVTDKNGIAPLEYASKKGNAKNFPWTILITGGQIFAGDRDIIDILIGSEPYTPTPKEQENK